VTAAAQSWLMVRPVAAAMPGPGLAPPEPRLAHQSPSLALAGVLASPTRAAAGSPKPLPGPGWCAGEPHLSRGWLTKAPPWPWLVCWRRGVAKKKQRWEAKVIINRTWAYREMFDTEYDAARAHDVALWRLKPTQAASYVNFPDTCPPHVADALAQADRVRGSGACLLWRVVVVVGGGGGVRAWLTQGSVVAVAGPGRKETTRTTQSLGCSPTHSAPQLQLLCNTRRAESRSRGSSCEAARTSRRSNWCMP